MCIPPHIFCMDYVLFYYQQATFHMGETPMASLKNSLMPTALSICFLSIGEKVQDIRYGKLGTSQGHIYPLLCGMSMKESVLRFLCFLLAFSFLKPLLTFKITYSRNIFYLRKYNVICYSFKKNIFLRLTLSG